MSCAVAAYISSTCRRVSLDKPVTCTRRATRLARLFWISALSVACRGPLPFAKRACDATAPLELTAERRDSLGPASIANDQEGQWARLARTAPGGFAGVYFESVPRNAMGHPTRQPRVVIRLARPDEGSAALHALLPQLPAAFGGLAIDSADVLIVPARWSFAQLVEWRQYLDVRVGSVGITSVDTDEVGNQIRYTVRDVEARKNLEGRLRKLRVPCGLVAVAIAGPNLPRAGTG